MKLALLENTDSQEFLNELDEFCNTGFKNIINIAYSTNTIQTTKVIEQTYGQLPDIVEEVVKTNYSALIQYT